MSFMRTVNRSAIPQEPTAPIAAAGMGGSYTPSRMAVASRYQQYAPQQMPRTMGDSLQYGPAPSGRINGGIGDSIGIRAGGGMSLANPNNRADAGGVQAGQANPQQQLQMQGPSAADIQAEQQRRQVGAQLGQDPRNAALSGYMMS